ncbi:MAG: cadherin-like domain-containing protein, partial [Rhodospirillaceae bacterium]|nr:cadherin-like domain-containing protein [Rhodospirillaceae bacterium]
SAKVAGVAFISAVDATSSFATMTVATTVANLKGADDLAAEAAAEALTQAGVVATKLGLTETAADTVQASIDAFEAAADAETAAAAAATAEQEGEQAALDAALASRTAKAAADAVINAAPEDAEAAKTAALSQVDTVTFAGTPEVDDTYSVILNAGTVDEETLTYTVEAGNTILFIRDWFETEINDNGGLSLVTASQGTADGKLVLTGDTPGDAFTIAAAATNVSGGTDDNTAVAAETIKAISATDTLSTVEVAAKLASDAAQAAQDAKDDADQAKIDVDAAELAAETAAGATGANDVAQDYLAKATAFVAEVDASVLDAGRALDAATTSSSKAAAQAAVAGASAADQQALLYDAYNNSITSADGDAEAQALRAETAEDVAEAAADVTLVHAAAMMESAIATAAKGVEFAAGSGGETTVGTMHSTMVDALETINTEGSDVAAALQGVIDSVNDVLDITEQEVTVTLGGTIEDGDIYRITVGATQAEYAAKTVDGVLDDLAAVRDGLIAAIEAKTAITDVVDVEAGFGDGEIVLTGPYDATVPFTYSVSTPTEGSDTSNTIEAAETGLEPILLGIVDGMTEAKSIASSIQSAVQDASDAAGLARQAATDLNPTTLALANDPTGPYDAGEAETNLAAADDYVEIAGAKADIAVDAAALADAKSISAEQAVSVAEAVQIQFEQFLAKAAQEELLAVQRAAADAVPIAGDDDIDAFEDTAKTFDVLSNDKRTDGDTLENPPPSIVSVGSAANGTVEIIAQVDTVTLAAGSPDVDDLYTVTVNGIQLTYKASGNEADAAAVAAEMASVINGNLVLGEIVDATVGSGGELVLTAHYAGEALTTTRDDNATAVETTVDNGSILYTPADNFFGIDKFTYTISNNFDPPSYSSATVTMDVETVNDAPDVYDDFARTASDNTAVTVTALFNDTDVEDDDLSIATVNGEAVVAGGTVTLASGAIVTVNSDGTFDYDPNGKFTELAAGDEEVETFTYTATDGEDASATAATVEVTVTGSNDAPVGVA